jgi:hypothetical protein
LAGGAVTAGLGRRARPVAVVSPVPAQVWDEVLASAPDVLPTQTPAWLRCVCAVGGHEDASRLYQTADGRRLVLPLARRRTLGGLLTTQASLPAGWGPGGLLGDGGVVLPEDVAMVAADLSAGRALGSHLRPAPAAAATWEQGMPAAVRRVPRMAHAVPLGGGFEDVWRRGFRGDTRTRVRRAERAGVVVERDDGGRLLPAFHRLYALSVDRWARRDGEPLPLARWLAARREPRRKLDGVAAMPGAGCRLYLASLDGAPIAAIVVLFAQGTAAYWRGAMDEQLAGRTYANYLLHRTAIEDAGAAGCAAYHMGDSAPGSPLALFKSRFGAVEQHYASYHLERIGMSGVAARARSGARRVLQPRAGLA